MFVSARVQCRHDYYLVQRLSRARPHPSQRLVDNRQHKQYGEDADETSDDQKENVC